MRIIAFDRRYRDDMIFMVLQAKDALGRVLGLNEDLLDVDANYMEKGGMFRLAVNDSDRVVGCIGILPVKDTSEAWVHRLFVKPELKRMGIGSRLLAEAEGYAESNNIKSIYVHLGEPKEQWYESYSFYPKHGFTAFSESPCIMKKTIG